MLRNQNAEHPSLKSLELITGPVTLPVSLAEIKNALRIDASVTTDDSLLTDCINAATSTLEKTFSLTLTAQTWTLWLDKWPMDKDWLPAQSTNTASPMGLSEVKALAPAVSLGLHPVSSITFIKTYDTDGAASTVDSATYSLDGSQKPSRVILNSDSFTWPTNDLRAAKAIEIKFVVGFASVPADLKMGVMSYAMILYAARGCGAQIPAAVYSSFLPYAGARL